jgi:hypothetical protein
VAVGCSTKSIPRLIARTQDMRPRVQLRSQLRLSFRGEGGNLSRPTGQQVDEDDRDLAWPFSLDGVERSWRQRRPSQARPLHRSLARDHNLARLLLHKDRHLDDSVQVHSTSTRENAKLDSSTSEKHHPTRC